MAAGPRSAPSGALAAPLTGSDHRPHEVALALLVALGVQVGATLALRAAALQHMADIREIDPGMEVPIRVRPVVDIDSPLLKLGGKAVKYKLPDQWIVPTPVQRVERRAFASPKADKSPEATPPEDVRMADAGTEPPPPDAAVAKQVDTEVTTPTDAGYANLPVEGSPDGVPEGTETDPLKARAISLYRARLIGWFSSRFRVSGSGLSPEELGKVRVGASVQLSNDRVVTGYHVVPSGNSAFDAAARATLEGTIGQQLPPPPENYPEAVQNQISLTFVCRPSTCD
jgi:hypothetical protein